LIVADVGVFEERGPCVQGGWIGALEISRAEIGELAEVPLTAIDM
jgi:hypothetical protein